jgi:hypothetical protein
MTNMTIRIPDDVKEAFDTAFEGHDKDAIIARLLQEAAESHAQSESLAERRRMAVDAILEHRKTMPAISQDEIRAIREEMRG